MQARTSWALTDPYAVETGWPAKTHRFRPDQRQFVRTHFSLFPIEPVARLAEGSLGEREHIGGLHREHEDCVGVCLVPEAALVHLVLPAAVPLRLPRLCEPFEDALLYHLSGLALDHDPPSSLPFVATGHQDHVLVGSQVHGLLLAEAGREMDRVIEPESDEWRRMRPTVRSD